MKISYFIVSSCFTLIFLAGCHNDKQKESITEIKGTIKNSKGQTLLLKELDVSTLFHIDSLTINNNEGYFNFEFIHEDAGMFILHNRKNDYILLILKPGEKVTVEADMSNMLGSYTITGSEESKLIKDYFTRTIEKYMMVEKIGDLFLSYQSDPDFYQVRDSLNLIFDSLYAEQREFTKTFIKSNPGTLAALWALNQRFGLDFLFNERDDMSYFLIIDSALHINYPGNKHTIDHHKRIEKIQNRKKVKDLAREKLQVDSIATDFTIPALDGELKSLHSVKSKYTILLFWASWSEPCRKKNKFLSEMYTTYKNKGLEIFAVSLDHNINHWKKAIEADGLDWIHTGDLKYPASPVQLLYNIEEIPYVLLLDSEKKILLVNPSGSQLENYLEAVL